GPASRSPAAAAAASVRAAPLLWLARKAAARCRWRSWFGWKDQAIGDRPPQHHCRADRQRRADGSVLQIDRDRGGAVDVDGIAPNIAEEGAAADPAGEHIVPGIAGGSRARPDLDPLRPDE